MILKLDRQTLLAEASCGLTRRFAFPAVAVSIGGRRIEAKTPVSSPQKISGGWKVEFRDGNCRFLVTVTPGGPDCFFKQVEIFAEEEFPTPDYVEVDFQKTRAPGLHRVGYVNRNEKTIGGKSEEEGHGVIPGCGYPLAGDDLFTGLEHPAAFNTVLSVRGETAVWQLRHFPVWQNGAIKSVRAVIGLGAAPRKLFFDYLDTVRLPRLNTPLIAFCTFWSDPYQGSMEYQVDFDSYAHWVEAFSELGLRPDIFTLDAGWQDRKSFYRAKQAYGGERALKELGNMIRAAGSDLSLWISTNGPVGMDMDFLRGKGIAVGGGASVHYSGSGFAVMMDRKLEKNLARRFCELASSEYGVRHFKIDWDNECATAPEFDRTYPTRDHVREASINMVARLYRLEKTINPDLQVRNGLWPSPWYLLMSSHVFLPDSGDCEYADFPALNQRDAATTHRDTMYWCDQVRDQSLFPLDAYDNHDFGHSLRNPFQESSGVWSNACVWAIMRGTSYHQFTLMPEALENWQADILRRTLEVLRKQAPEIITGRSRMFGGNPAAGEIYGFLHPGPKGKVLLALRNSSPLPQEYSLPDHAPYYEQYYPDCRCFRSGENIVFAPHEVKVLLGVPVLKKSLPEYPCRLVPVSDSQYECYLPASRKPAVGKLHQTPELRQIRSEVRKDSSGLELDFGLRVPWRMRDFKLLFRITGKNRNRVTPSLRTSRQPGCSESCFTLPVTELPFGNPGSGEMKNPDVIPPRGARYFAADLPQGGEVFCSLRFTGAVLRPDDIELWVSGYEAPARSPEKKRIRLSWCLPLPHPDGFPQSLRLRMSPPKSGSDKKQSRRTGLKRRISLERTKIAKNSKERKRS